MAERSKRKFIPAIDMEDKAYKRQVRAWTMYDWANSAFATTIMAAVLPRVSTVRVQEELYPARRLRPHYGVWD